MALAQIKKVAFLARHRDRERLMEVLQAAGCVHLDEVDAVFKDSDAELPALFQSASELREQIVHMEKQLHELSNAIQLLTPFGTKPSLSARMGIAAPATDLDTFQTYGNIDSRPIIEQLQTIQINQQTYRSEIEELRSKREPLELFAGVDIPLEHFHDGQRYFVSILKVRRRQWSELSADLETSLNNPIHAHEVALAADHAAVLITGAAETRPAFDEWVDRHSITTLELSAYSGTAGENLERFLKREKELRSLLASTEEELASLASNLPILHAAYDYTSAHIDRLKEGERVRESNFAALAAGWIRADDVPRLENSLQEAGIDVHIMTADTSPDDNPPVAYKNSNVVGPFELITDLYSRPRPGEIDPTPYVTVFFAFYLGICLTDAGYGLILAIIAFLMLRYVKTLGEGSRKLVRILYYSGIATVVVGTLTGGYFGLAPSDLPGSLKHLDRLVILAPLEDQMTFLVFTLVMGILQVSFGYMIQLHSSIRHGNIKDALLDQMPWLAIIIGAVFLIIGGGVLPEVFTQVGIVTLLTAAIVILLFGARDMQNPILRLGGGAFALYQVTGLFGDILSYVRLFALGLATGVIAGVVNFIAQLVAGVPYVGLILMVVVLILGHALNLVINALGGFIHTTRLQFVEFFGKFYEGGGKPFNAFQLNTRYTTVHDSE